MGTMDEPVSLALQAPAASDGKDDGSYASSCNCFGRQYVCATGSCFCWFIWGYCRETTPSTNTPSTTPPSTNSSGDYPNCGPSAIDPDRDGWGWENNASCRMVSGSGTGAGNSTGGNTGTTGGYPDCALGAMSDPDGDGWGWENNASCRVVGGGGSGGTSPAANFQITGRISMGTMDGNQCGIRYTGNERVGSSKELIAGIDTPNFGVWTNGVPGNKCGRIAKVNVNGKQYRFVIVDRIWENTGSNQLDVAKEFYYQVMGQNWKANVEITSEIAPGITCDSWVFQHEISKSYCTNR